MIDFKKLAKNYYSEALNNLIGFLKINSVYDENTVSDENPYGLGVSKALNFLKDLAQKYGFKANVYNNRVTEIIFGEKGNDIGIFAHSDVVPATGKWDSDPFSPEIRDNKLYARGTSDDKGPLMAAFFALVLLKENNLIDDYKVRLVSGGDEERGSSCLSYYFETLKKPDVDFGFTPDADFPLIYGEKGITNYSLKDKIDLKDIVSIEAGVASNCVIDRAVVELKDSTKFIEYLKNKNVNFSLEENKIVFNGKSAHGSTPELGVNSGIIMLECLGDFYEIDVLKELAYQYKDYNGKNLNQYYYSENMGVTTYNVGLITYKDGVFEMVVNFRYPEIVDVDKVIDKIKEISPLNLYTERASHYLYFDPNCEMVKTLLDVYQKETGDYKSKPMTIGGGTYAKEAKNTIAFGSHFPGREDNIHSPNEKIDLDDFYNSISIYAHAIYKLGKLKK